MLIELTRLLQRFSPFVVAVLWITACALSRPAPAPSPTAISTPVAATPQGTADAVDAWLALHLRTPFPYLRSLPAAAPSPLDGVYVKFDPKAATPVPCLRCPDYAPEGGIWKLSLDDGIFRIYHTVTDWKSIASFTVSGDRVELFNDPTCLDDVGVYTWQLAEGELTFSVVEDKCAILLRAQNLTSIPWQSCQPPNREAAVSGHWPALAGC
jgi:hypothetical protein